MSNEHEWLNLVEVSGPFLAVPVLRDVFPQGLEALPSGRPQRLRRTYEEWRDAVDMDDLDLPALHAAWIDEVLVTALEIDETVVRKGTSRPERLTVQLRQLVCPPLGPGARDATRLRQPARCSSLLRPGSRKASDAVRAIAEAPGRRDRCAR